MQCSTNASLWFWDDFVLFVLRLPTSWPNAGLMLGQRCRRCSNIKPALDYGLLFDEGLSGVRWLLPDVSNPGPRLVDQCPRRLNPFCAGDVYRRQNLTSIDPDSDVLTRPHTEKTKKSYNGRRPITWWHRFKWSGKSYIYDDDFKLKKPSVSALKD